MGGRRCEARFGRRMITYDSPTVRITDHINTQEVKGYVVYKIIIGDGDKKTYPKRIPLGISDLSSGEFAVETG